MARVTWFLNFKLGHMVWPKIFFNTWMYAWWQSKEIHTSYVLSYITIIGNNKILSNRSGPKNLEAYGCHGFWNLLKYEDSEGLSKDSVFSQIMHAHACACTHTHTHTHTFLCCRKSYQGFRLVNFSKVMTRVQKPRPNMFSFRSGRGKSGPIDVMLSRLDW